MFVDEARDARLHTFQQPLVLSTVERQSLEAPQPRWAYSGAVQERNGIATIWATEGLSSQRHSAIGLLIRSPNHFGDRVAYRVRGQARCSDYDILAIGFVAIGPANPSNSAAGQATHWPSHMGIVSANGSTYIDELIVLDQIGEINSVDYSARPVAFGWTFYNRSSNARNNVRLLGNISVQCLAVQSEGYRDRRKQ